ncbi:MAG: hypothetical protein C0514_00115 [Candidatus Puniceispirillum sp.]|nr:hypothetical protein [Candidatus Puniceispirillum sp.]
MASCQASEFFSHETIPEIDSFTTTKKSITPFVGKVVRVNCEKFQCNVCDAGAPFLNRLSEGDKVTFYRSLGQSREFYANFISGGKNHEMLRLIPVTHSSAK